MLKIRMVLLALLAAVAFTFSAAPLASADQNVCAPGQHGNPHPGFKPGSCKK